MTPRCTCGAVLPEDARFCHKCGKPQYEEDVARLSALESNSVPTPPTPSVSGAARAGGGISFKNSRAVLITLIVAGGTLLGIMATSFIAPVLAPVVLCGAGFIAVRIYNTQTAEPVTAAAGARLGWMTGLWLFIAVAVVFALAALIVSSPQGWEQLKTTWAQLPQTSTLASLTQHDFLIQLLIGLPFSFFLLTLLPGLGGMLGAKLSARRRPS